MEETVGIDFVKCAVITALISASPVALAGKKVAALDTDFVLVLGGGDTSTTDLDVDPTRPADPAPADPEINTTYGMTLRAGYQVSFVIVDLSLEAGVRSMQFTTDDPLMAIYGGRVNIGKLIKPGMYIHGLYGFDGTSGWEAGLTGDFTAIPILNIGLQVGYGSMSEREWLNAGAHIGVQF
jgi:hypothetical protein